MAYFYYPPHNVYVEMQMKEAAEIAGITLSAVSRRAKVNGYITRLGAWVSVEPMPLRVRRKLYVDYIDVGERWKPCLNTLGLEGYEVSNLGRLRRLGKSGKHIYSMPYMPMVTGSDRRAKRVKVNGKVYHMRRVVANEWLKPVPGKEMLTHKNGDYADCSATNIKYVSKREASQRSGRNQPASKGVVKLCAETRDVLGWYRSAREAARENAYSYQAVIDRCNGKVKKQYDAVYMWEADFDKTEM